VVVVSVVVAVVFVVLVSAKAVKLTAASNKTKIPV
jgi:hypothetical protein